MFSVNTSYAGVSPPSAGVNIIKVSRVSAAKTRAMHIKDSKAS
jgi:hypothetical protein